MLFFWTFCLLKNPEKNDHAYTKQIKEHDYYKKCFLSTS